LRGKLKPIVSFHRKIKAASVSLIWDLKKLTSCVYYRYLVLARRIDYNLLTANDLYRALSSPNSLGSM
jgi:hypothetical protein